jgi:hypothetical protein
MGTSSFIVGKIAFPITSLVTNHIGAFSNQAQEPKQSHHSLLESSTNWFYNRSSSGHAGKPQTHSNEQAQAHAYIKDKAIYGTHKLYANAYNSKSQTKQTHELDT